MADSCFEKHERFVREMRADMYRHGVPGPVVKPEPEDNEDLLTLKEEIERRFEDLFGDSKPRKKSRR